MEARAGLRDSTEFPNYYNQFDISHLFRKNNFTFVGNASLVANPIQTSITLAMLEGYIEINTARAFFIHLFGKS